MDSQMDLWKGRNAINAWRGRVLNKHTMPFLLVPVIPLAGDNCYFSQDNKITLSTVFTNASSILQLSCQLLHDTYIHFQGEFNLHLLQRLFLV